MATKKFKCELCGYIHEGDKAPAVCVSEVIDISPGSLDASLCFIQSSVSHDVLCI